MTNLPAAPSSPRRTLLRRLLGVALLGGAGLSLTACGGSDPNYYTLAYEPGAAAPGGPLNLEVRTPTITPSLQRDHIVRNNRDYRLVTIKDAAWADSLDELIGRTLALDLNQRLPGTAVFTQGSAISNTPALLVELDVEHFAADTEGRAELQATVSVHRPDSGPGTTRSLHLHQQPTGPGTAELVGALSKLLGQVADQVATLARAVPPAALPPA